MLPQVLRRELLLWKVTPCGIKSHARLLIELIFGRYRYAALMMVVIEQRIRTYVYRISG